MSSTISYLQYAPEKHPLKHVDTAPNLRVVKEQTAVRLKTAAVPVLTFDSSLFTLVINK